MKACGRLTTSLALALLLVGCVAPDPEPIKLSDATCDETEGYPAGPYGTVPCEPIMDLCFEPANEPAAAIAGDDGGLSIGDLLADESVAGVLLFGTAGWCQFCTQESAWLNSTYESLQDLDGEGRRIEVVAVVFEDDYGGSVTREYAEAYAEHKGLVFPAVADSQKSILHYFDASAAPGNIFIGADGAVISQVLQGFDQQALEQALSALDGEATCH